MNLMPAHRKWKCIIEGESGVYQKKAKVCIWVLQLQWKWEIEHEQGKLFWIWSNLSKRFLLFWRGERKLLERMIRGKKCKGQLWLGIAIVIIVIIVLIVIIIVITILKMWELLERMIEERNARLNLWLGIAQPLSWSLSLSSLSSWSLS